MFAAGAAVKIPIEISDAESLASSQIVSLPRLALESVQSLSADANRDPHWDVLELPHPAAHEDHAIQLQVLERGDIRTPRLGRAAEGNNARAMHERFTRRNQALGFVRVRWRPLASTKGETRGPSQRRLTVLTPAHGRCDRWAGRWNGGAVVISN